MKKYLLLFIALSTPHILFADQGTKISSTESLRPVNTTTQETKEFSLINIIIGRIQDNPKLLKAFKSACVSCVENLADFKSRTLPPEKMDQIASAVKEFAQQNNIAPEMKYFQNK